MGYQESYIYTSRLNPYANKRDIDALLALFKKYGIRCRDDLWAECVCRLHFNRRVHGFRKGMEMLVICGERSIQRSGNSLAGYRSSDNVPLILEKKEAALINRVKFLPIEDAMPICYAEKTDAITVEQLLLMPTAEYI